MAKSVSVLLLAVFAFAVFPHTAHRFSAAASISFAGIGKLGARLGPEIESFLKALPKTFKNPSELKEKINDFGDVITDVIEKYNEAKGLSSTALPPGCNYFPVTSIRVGEDTLGEGSMILVRRALFLNTQAYGLLKEKLQVLNKDLTAAAPTSSFGRNFDQLCYNGVKADQLPVITLTIPLATPLKQFWYDQTDGPTCLAILS
jgi:hypothetical protein